MATEVGVAYVSIIPSARGFAQKLQGEVGGEVSKFGSTAGAASGKSFHTGFLGGAKGLVTGIGGLLAASAVKNFFTDSIAEAREAQKVTAQTNAVIKSTGGVANVSAKQISNLANAISLKSGMDDEAIQTGANMLLTFRNLRNETGKGNDVFNQATQAITDLSVSMGQDMKSSAIQLGKALNDPVKGITALSRVGVTFDDQQKNQIKTMVAHNNVIGAQKVILAELTKEFGGSAAAQATAGDKMKVAWKNLEEQIGTALLPVLDKLETALVTKGIPAASKFISQMQSGKGAGGDFARTLGNIKDDAVQFANVVLPLVKGVVSAFNRLPDSAQKMLILAGGAYALNRRLGGMNGLLPGLNGGMFTLGRNTAKAGEAAKGATGYFGGLKQAIGIAAFIKLAQGTLDVTDSFDRWKRAGDGLKPTLKGITQQLKDSNLGKNADEFHINVDHLAQDIARFGDKGAYFQKVMKRLQGDTGIGAFANAELGAIIPGYTSHVEKATNATTDLLKVTQKFVKTSADTKRVSFDLLTMMDPALAGLQRYRTGLLKLPARVLTKVETPGAIQSVKDVEDLAKKFKLQPREIRTILRAEDFSSAQIHKVMKELDIVGKQHPKPVVAADIKNAMAGVRTTLAAFGLVGKAHPKGTLNANPKPATLATQVALGWFGKVDKTRAMAILDANNGQALTKVQAVRNAIQGLINHPWNIFIGTTGPGAGGKHARGGLIVGPGTGTSDSIAAQLSNGEFVMRAAAVRRYGLDTLNQMNTMRLASSGPVGARLGAQAAAPATASGPSVAVFNLYDANNVLIGTMQGVAAQTAHAANRVSMQRANSARRTGIG